MPATVAEACRETRIRLASVDWPVVAGCMGKLPMPEGIRIPFFGEAYWIGPQGCHTVSGDPASEAVELVLNRYVLRFPALAPPDGACVTFRELEGAGPLSQRFADNTQKIITTTFGRSADRLRAAAQTVKGCRPHPKRGFDLALSFEALPQLPLYLQFNAEDDELPAQAALLFHCSAAVYLDLQTLFIVATYLTGRLITAVGRNP